MTTRRDVLRGLAGCLALAAPLPGTAQAASNIPRIGYLSMGTAKSNGVFLDALRDGLRELGWIDGKNVVLEVRFAGANGGLFPQYAASLVNDKPSAIVTTCIPSTRAAKQATPSIPVVMSIDGDPVKAGLVASYARPGGNVTGSSTLFEELFPKWLELLVAAVPKAHDVAFLTNSDNPVEPYYWARFEEAARQSGVKVLTFGTTNPAEFERVFEEMKRKGSGALVVMTEAFLAGQIERIVPLANRTPLPAIYGYREFAEAGGLMSYGLSFRDHYKGVARYIDQVLKGTRPADLPVQQPTKIELAINLATARKLGVAIPPQLLARADRVFE